MRTPADSEQAFLFPVELLLEFVFEKSPKPAKVLVMHSMMIFALYNSIGGILRKISAHPDTQASASLMKEVQTAVGFHQVMERPLKAWDNESVKIHRKLAEFLDKDRVVDTSTLNRLVKKYQHFRELGATPLVIHKMALNENVSERDQPRVLCSVFKFSTEEAQAIIQEYNTKFA